MTVLLCVLAIGVQWIETTDDRNLARASAIEISFAVSTDAIQTAIPEILPAGTTGPIYTVLSAPFACPPCEILKAKLGDMGKRFVVRVDADRTEWPGLLVDGVEVDAMAYLRPVAAKTVMKSKAKSKAMVMETRHEVRRERVGRGGLFRAIGRAIFRGANNRVRSSMRSRHVAHGAAMHGS